MTRTEIVVRVEWANGETVEYYHRRCWYLPITDSPFSGELVALDCPDIRGTKCAECRGRLDNEM